MDMRKVVGWNVLRLRRERGLSQEELSFRSGFGRAYLSGLETGKRNPTVVTLWELATALDATPIDLLKPLFIKGEMPTQGKVVIGTVKGDLHDIGKNLVGIMLKGAGYEVVDVGCDVASSVFVDTAEAEGASVVGLSALLTTTMIGMKDVVELVKERGLQDKIKVVVGGAPLSQAFADEIGADAYGYDAGNAVEIVKGLM